MIADDIIEKVIRAYAGGAVSWGQTGSGGGWRYGGASYERAAFALRGINGSDLAILAWSCGAHDDRTRGEAYGTILLDAAGVKGRDDYRQSVSRGTKAAPWPKGRMQALSRVALEELGNRAEHWDEVRRRRALERHEKATMPAYEWAKRWREHYRELLGEQARREGRARLLIVEQWRGFVRDVDLA